MLRGDFSRVSRAESTHLQFGGVRPPSKCPVGSETGWREGVGAGERSHERRRRRREEKKRKRERWKGRGPRGSTHCAALHLQ